MTCQTNKNNFNDKVFLRIIYHQFLFRDSAKELIRYKKLVSYQYLRVTQGNETLKHNDKSSKIIFGLSLFEMLYQELDNLSWRNHDNPC